MPLNFTGTQRGTNTGGPTWGTDHTIAAWFRPEALFDLCTIALGDETENAFGLYWNADVQALQYRAQYGTTDGVWAFSVSNDGAWVFAAVVYRQAVGNQPTFYVKGFEDFDVTDVGNIETNTPVGTSPTPRAGIVIGNNNVGSLPFGKLAHVQLWNRLLELNEVRHAMRRPGAVRNGLDGYWPLLNSGDDLSGNGWHLTFTGSPSVDRTLGPPCIPVMQSFRSGARTNAVVVDEGIAVMRRRMEGW